ncbi:MAG: F0F1 ATP synthase subunit epsilon, partial [SAR324 cluster bacterium]|nr:F0F1 ATP synthase subunit epsilon [SAR324 cluster bacterium]
GNRVTVLTEMAERREEIDAGRARSSEERARKELRELADDKAEEGRIDKYEAKLNRAVVRLSL